MKIKLSLSLLLILSFTSLYASEITGSVSNGGSNNVGNINTGGSQSTSTSTLISGTVIVTPTANVPSGVFINPISIALSALNADSIGYTLDNTVPTCARGTVYNSTITVASTTTLKALSCYGVKSSNLVTYQYNFRTLSDNQIIPVNGSATIDASKTQIVITDPNQAINLTVNNAVMRPTLDISTFIQNGSGTLPEINIMANNANNISIKIPNGAIVTSTSIVWNGIISAPIIKTVSLVNPSGFTRSLSQAIEVGVSGSKLSFTKGIRILLNGQAGKKTGWTRDDTNYIEITNTCTSDNQITGDALAVDGDCKIDIGNNLVIWTKHFTTFVTYTETAVSNPVVSSGGGGGGGGYYVSPIILTATATNTTKATDTATTSLIVTKLNTATTNLSSKTNIKSTSTKFIFTLDLSLGSNNKEVLELQKILATLGVFKSKPGGYFGPVTQKAVKDWQVKNKIKATGLFGSISRAKLNK